MVLICIQLHTVEILTSTKRTEAAYKSFEISEKITIKKCDIGERKKDDNIFNRNSSVNLFPSQSTERLQKNFSALLFQFFSSWRENIFVSLCLLFRWNKIIISEEREKDSHGHGKVEIEFRNLHFYGKSRFRRKDELAESHE